MIRVCEPYFAAEDRARLIQALERNEIAKGSDLPEAERLLSAVAGRPVRVVANGTAACHLCMLGLGVRAGQKVGVPALTYVATANAVRYQGAEPVFFDVRRDVPVADASCLATAAAAGAQGAWIVHLYGKLVPDADRWSAAAAKAGLWLAEDVAEGFGGTVAGRPTGSFGAIAAYSFYANKNITSGEGGAVAVADAALLRTVGLFMNQGVEAGGSFDHEVVGFNYRMTNIQAALLVGQLTRLGEIARRKREIQAWYEQRLAASKLGRMLALGASEVPWLCSFVFADHAARERSIDVLKQHGVETRRGFTPIPALKPYGSMPDAEVAERFPNARYWSRHLLNLPSALSLTEADVDQVVQGLAHV